MIYKCPKCGGVTDNDNLFLFHVQKKHPVYLKGDALT